MRLNSSDTCLIFWKTNSIRGYSHFSGSWQPLTVPHYPAKHYQSSEQLLIRSFSTTITYSKHHSSIVKGVRYNAENLQYMNIHLLRCPHHLVPQCLHSIIKSTLSLDSTQEYKLTNSQDDPWINPHRCWSTVISDWSHEKRHQSGETLGHLYRFNSYHAEWRDKIKTRIDWRSISLCTTC